MKSKIGWILDAYIEEDEAILWLRTEKDEIIKLRDKYNPSFYILPKSKEDGDRLFSLLQREASVVRAQWEHKYTNLSDKKEDLLCVTLDSTANFKTMIKKLRGHESIKELFNIDLLHIQRYLFSQLNIEPTSKVEVEFDESNYLVKAKKINDEKEIHPPPFTLLYFDINPSSPAITPNPDRDPIGSIEVKFGEEEAVLEGKEERLLQDFAQYVQSKDPDFLICPECDAFTFPYIFKRVKLLGLNIKLGREDVNINTLKKPLPYWVKGRVSLDYNQYGYTFDDWGLAGLVERARFSFLPPGIAFRWTSNRIIDSRNCYELIKRDHAIPKDIGYFEYVRPIKDIIERDKGGMIISPRIGMVHENVAELDFDSEYPNIIVHYNISYETVTPRGIVKKEDAILPYVTKQALERRLYFKKLRKSFPKDSLEWQYCDQRQSALKLILVCLYGTSGCCWNRFGNVLAFEEINRQSREIMIKVKDFVQKLGYELIYADTDSVFVKKSEATKEDYEDLARRISEHIGLPMSLDHHYKFLLLLPLESDPSMVMEAQKHYFGMLYDGEIIARGIELRRHDTPKFIKDFQARLIRILFSCKDAKEVQTVGYGKALQLVTETIDKLMIGEVPMEELVVSKILRKPIARYKSVFPHVSAAIQLASRGKKVKEGESVDFIFVDADHYNPLCRVVAYELANSKIHQDKEKYRDMVLDAAETVLSTFGFSREIYGLIPPEKSWIKELWEDRKREIVLESESEEPDR
ncbi:MAG: DNA-directed DNA polymerase [Nitrososphaerales archaeon]